MKEIKWTKQQKEAICDRGNNLLVSASAGSGKTTVMTQRIVDLIVNEKIPISNFLVVTFTKASAQDMKQKIITKLLESEQSDFVLQQIEDVLTSDISDLHSFYSRLVSTYFYEAQIDPSFHIVDELESSWLKERAIKRVFEQREAKDDIQFFELVDIFQKKRQDAQLKEVVFNFQDFLSSQIDDDWFKKTLESSYNPNLEENVCAKSINNYVVNRVKKLADKIDEFLKLCNDFACEKYYNHFVELSSKIRAVKPGATFIQNAKAVFEITFSNLPRVKKEFYDLNLIALELNSKVKNEFDNFKENYISCDEEMLVSAIKFAREKLIFLYEIVKDFEQTYSKMKAEIRGLDFNDLEHFALKILSNEEIAKTVREKYKYIFVDEYQDINEIQEKIISIISSPNNRFMVGDLKQSIYRFRLCDPDIFIQKFKEYSSAKVGSKTINLNCNFRSDKKILKFVDRVFSDVMTEEFGDLDYKKTSKFEPGEENLDEPSSTTLCFIDKTKDDEEKFARKKVYSLKNHEKIEAGGKMAIVSEAKYVADKIYEIMKNDKDAKFSDFAVLVFSRNPKITKFIEVLNSLKIPVSADNKLDLLSQNYIEEILDFAKFLIQQNDDYLTFKVLKSKLFSFSDEELIELRLINKKLDFHDLIHLKNQIKNDKLALKLSNFYNLTEKFKNIVKVTTIKDLVKKIIDEFKLYEINLLCRDGEKRISEIDKFIRSLPNKTALEFLINSDNISLIYENECGGNAVKVMTVHKSKGIEFKYVFLINTNSKIKYDSANGKILLNKNFGAGLDFFDEISRRELPTVPMSFMRLIEKRKIAEEQQRVLYVALTRAVKKLFVICSKSKNKLSQTFPERPILYENWFEPIICSELSGNHDENLVFEYFTSEQLSVSVKPEEKQLIFKEEDVQKYQEISYPFLSSVQVPLKNSISKIFKMGDEFYSEEFDDEFERYEKNFKGEQISSATRGTAYHKFFQFFDLKKIDFFEEQCEKVKAKMGEELWKFIDLSKVKQILLLPFFSEIKAQDTLISEREFFATMPASIVKKDATGEIILQGVVDLILIRENEIFVLDYKTGKIDDEKFKRYSFQISAYADAIERAYEKKVTKKILCLIDEKKLIEI